MELSNYSLNVVIADTGHDLGNDEVLMWIVSKVRNISDDASLAFTLTGESEDAISWHNFEEDMKSVSLLEPTLRFSVEVKGYTHEGFSMFYFHNGKMQEEIGTIEYPKFDPKKLK